jgi:hypothetical protein
MDERAISGQPGDAPDQDLVGPDSGNGPVEVDLEPVDRDRQVFIPGSSTSEAAATPESTPHE